MRARSGRLAFHRRPGTSGPKLLQHAYHKLLAMSLARPCEPPPSRRTVVFLAFGTRGDVQPLAIICRALATSSDDLFAVFVTHQEHRAWLARLLAATAAGVVYVDTPAALGAPGLEPADGSRKRAARDEEALWSSQQRRAQANLQQDADALVPLPTAAGRRYRFAVREQRPIHRARGGRRRRRRPARPRR